MKTAEQTNDPQVGQVETYPTSQCLECGRLNDEIADLKAKLEAAQGQVAHLQDALECIERAVGFVPKDEPLAAWVVMKMNELEAFKVNGEYALRLALASQTERLQKEREAAQKACAEMRKVCKSAYLLIIEHHSSLIMREELISCPVCESKRGNAVLDKLHTSYCLPLKSHCGKDYVSKEKVRPLVEALRLLEGRVGYNELPTVTQALAHAKQIGL